MIFSMELPLDEWKADSVTLENLVRIYNSSELATESGLFDVIEKMARYLYGLEWYDAVFRVLEFMWNTGCPTFHRAAMNILMIEALHEQPFSAEVHAEVHAEITGGDMRNRIWFDHDCYCWWTHIITEGPRSSARVMVESKRPPNVKCPRHVLRKEG